MNFYFVSSASNFTLIGDNYEELAAEPPIPLQGKIDIFQKKLFWLKIRNFYLYLKNQFWYLQKKVFHDSQNYTKNLLYYVSQSDSTVDKSFYLNILKLIWKFFGNSAILPRKDY